ncbi:hypothetical protein [Trichloromonas sp.]|nr:hypothetical protein [Trichloromonas sp.]
MLLLIRLFRTRLNVLAIVRLFTPFKPRSTPFLFLRTERMQAMADG